jgi:hypothetical protein
MRMGTQSLPLWEVSVGKALHYRDSGSGLLDFEPRDAGALPAFAGNTAFVALPVAESWQCSTTSASDSGQRRNS